MKVVTKMLKIENEETDFTELEIFEQEMPGATGLSLAARATRTRDIRGGVIADAMGAGKTVISIAIILKGLKEARTVRNDPSRKRNETGATLVCVPPALIDQWGKEIEKFDPVESTRGLKVVKIYESTTNVTVGEILSADVVLAPIDILDSNGTYLQRLLAASGETIKAPSLPPFDGQSEQSGARGVWCVRSPVLIC